MEWHAVISNIHTWCLSVKWPVTNKRMILKQTVITGRRQGDQSNSRPHSLPWHDEGIMLRPAYSELISNRIISNIFLLQWTRQENKQSRLNGKSWEKKKTKQNKTKQLQHQTTLQPVQYLCMRICVDTFNTDTHTCTVTCAAHTAFTLHLNHSAYNGAP